MRTHKEEYKLKDTNCQVEFSKKENARNTKKSQKKFRMIGTRGIVYREAWGYNNIDVLNCKAKRVKEF